MITFNEMTKTYLRTKLKDISATDFVGRGVIKELDADDARLKEIAECEHRMEQYKGTKTCCCKCNTMVEKGNFEEWEIK